MCLVVTCWERADLLALVCGVLLWVCYFPIGILGQVWHLIVSIPDLSTLSYFVLIRSMHNSKHYVKKSFVETSSHLCYLNKNNDW